MTLLQVARSFEWQKRRGWREGFKCNLIVKSLWLQAFGDSLTAASRSKASCDRALWHPAGPCMPGNVCLSPAWLRSRSDLPAPGCQPLLLPALLLSHSRSQKCVTAALLLGVQPLLRAPFAPAGWHCQHCREGLALWLLSLPQRVTSHLSL